MRRKNIRGRKERDAEEVEKKVKHGETEEEKGLKRTFSAAYIVFVGIKCYSMSSTSIVESKQTKKM